MRSPARLASAVGAAFLAAAVPSLAEDLVVVFKTDGPGGPGTSTQYFSAERMRSHEGDTDTLFDYESGMITNIDHKKKEYSQITLEEIEAAMESVNAELAKAQAQMEAMPAAIRERMAKMMGGMGGEVVVTKGGTRQVAGYATQEYTITMGETLTMNLWNTTDLAIPMPEAALQRMRAFAGPMAAMATNPMFKGFGQLAEKMQEIGGLTLADKTSTSVMGRGSESSREATEVRTGAIPASDLDLAVLTSGYKKVDSPLSQLGKR